MQAVAKGPGFVTREYFLGQGDLLGHPEHELNRLEALRRLWRPAIDDPHDHDAGLFANKDTIKKHRDDGPPQSGLSIQHRTSNRLTVYYERDQGIQFAARAR